MNKHTPGPWTFEFEDDDSVLSIKAGENGVLGGCGCCGSPWCSLEDARLISAAPELLDAADMALRLLEDFVEDPRVQVEINATVTELKKAISKAIGEQT
jgi:hypothetical protein